MSGEKKTTSISPSTLCLSARIDAPESEGPLGGCHPGRRPPLRRPPAAGASSLPPPPLTRHTHHTPTEKHPPLPRSPHPPTRCYYFIFHLCKSRSQTHLITLLSRHPPSHPSHPSPSLLLSSGGAGARLESLGVPRAVSRAASGDTPRSAGRGPRGASQERRGNTQFHSHPTWRHPSHTPTVVSRRLHSTLVICFKGYGTLTHQRRLPV